MWCLGFHHRQWPKSATIAALDTLTSGCPRLRRRYKVVHLLPSGNVHDGGEMERVVVDDQAASLIALNVDSGKMETRGIQTARDELCDTIKRTTEPDTRVGGRHIHGFASSMAEEEDGAYMRLLLVVAVKHEDFTHPRALASNLAQPLGYQTLRSRRYHRSNDQK